MSIRIQNLVKNYPDKEVLKNISLRVEPGMSLCLLGLNGAGKSTLINILLDLIPFDSGEIRIFDSWYDKEEMRLKKKIGAVPETLPLIPEMSGKSFLEFVGTLYDVPAHDLKHRIEDITEYLFDDYEDLAKDIKSYSTGMKMKLAVCAAILHNPDILILDEPFAGLDVVSSTKLVSLLHQLTEQNKIIFISSHNLSYVEQFCTHVAVLDEGIIKFNGTMQEFLQRGQEKIDAALLQYLNVKESEQQTPDWLR